MEDFVDEERSVEAKAAARAAKAKAKAKAKEAKASGAAAFESEWGEALHEEKQEKLLSRDQIGEIAEAVEMMAADSPVARQKEGLTELEEGREALREEIEGQGDVTYDLLLDSRVSAMLSKLKRGIEQTEMTIGEALHSLDLDHDGVVTHEELVEAMESIHGQTARCSSVHELIEQIDVDKDGVSGLRILLKEIEGKRTKKEKDEEKSGGGSSSGRKQTGEMR